MRDKWNQKHGAQTYGEMTISKVLSNFSPYISSFTPKINSNTQSNSNENSTPSETLQASQSSDNINSTGILPDASPISSRNIHSYIYGIINDWQLKSDLSRFRNFSDRKTGFSNIDSYVSFYPGLYVLGAISSLGKTTFIHQLADQLVRSGEHVLFFSLEQTCLELVTKLIKPI